MVLLVEDMALVNRLQVRDLCGDLVEGLALRHLDTHVDLEQSVQPRFSGGLAAESLVANWDNLL